MPTKEKVQTVEVFLGGEGKSVSLEVSAKEMKEVGTTVNSGRPFVTINDVHGDVHVFNLGHVLAITKPGVHDLYDTITPSQIMLQLHEKDALSTSDLLKHFGIKSAKSGSGPGPDKMMGLDSNKPKKPKK